MTFVALATAFSLSMGDTPPQKLDIKLDKVDTPTVSMPDLGTGGVPKAEGLKSDEAQPSGPQLKQTDGDTVVRRGAITIDKVVHANDFARRGTDQIPKGAFAELNLYSVPAKIPPFKTCLTLNSPDGMTVPIVVMIRSPAGETLLASRGPVVFDGPGKMDFVIDWAGFEARMAGNYHLTVQLGVQKAQDFPLPLKIAK
jgi:hypothetical protein